MNWRAPYRAMIRLYPKPYRDTYGEQMIQTLSDMLDGAPSAPAKSILMIRAVVELPASIFTQQLAYAGGAIMNDLPDYAKYSTRIGGLLLLPFACALAANSIDRLIRHQSLYSSWLWHMPVLSIWVLWMPVAAALLTLGSLLVLFARRVVKDKANWKQQLASLIQAWRLIAVLAVSVGILGIVFFHDSVHCITGNPIREVRDAPATVRCIEQR